ncbi:MAG: tRNA (adenosine(37)-N6)-threonylcarbamoyltransferase complex transferase subunit TsaD [Candidatus Buchananbacteria bacterium]|nr:tRNA (adenosine(37)-N6)-threonylcarbamoyltransferase complex transferase subunit TsaD [Candidatus Buchananbacteria bacterium]
MEILAIETSCDETAVAVLEIKGQNYQVLANLVSSQINIHKKYGGIVPEVAARKHVENVIPLLEKANINKDNIDVIGIVYGPGLITSLIVGLETAKTLSLVWQKPLVPVDHIKAHILANLIRGNQGELLPIKFPALALVVSGGHTSLVLMKDTNSFQTIGQTRDDAVGEAFDKVAKLLDLGYPGGPIISQHAQKADKTAFDLPRPMIDTDDFDFSFSGLKTAVRQELAQIKVKDKKVINNMAASFQQAAIDVLIAKTVKAAKKYKVKSILLGGGVSANKELRNQLSQAVKKELKWVEFWQPDLSNTTDNALMVAVGAYFKYQQNPYKYKNYWKKIKVEPNLEL